MASHFTDLPMELVQLVLGSVLEVGTHSECIATLCALRSTCRLFYKLVAPALYSAPWIKDCHRLNKLLLHTRDRPELLSLTKGLSATLAPEDFAHIPLGLQQFHQLRSLWLAALDLPAAAVHYSRYDIFPSLELFSLQTYVRFQPPRGRLTLKFEQILPMLASPKLRTLIFDGFNLVGQYDVERLPPFEELRYHSGDDCRGIAEGIQAVRSPSVLSIDICCDGPHSTSRQMVDTFAKDITELLYNCHIRYVSSQQPFSLQHCNQLQRLQIRAENLALLYPRLGDNEYANEVVDPSLLTTFPTSLNFLGVHAQSVHTHRLTFYDVLVTMVNRRDTIFPNLRTLLIVCWEKPHAPPETLTPETFTRGYSWAAEWNHRRVAPAEIRAVPVEAGETEECRVLRSICQRNSIELIAENDHGGTRMHTVDELALSTRISDSIWDC